jgi:hypothetical protein
MQVYKIFIFNSNTGELIKEEAYSNFTEVQQEIINHNNTDKNNRWNIYVGTQFPPSGVKFDTSIKQFVEKTLSEKVADGEFTIPLDFKIVDNVLVRLTKKELLEKGLISISHDEKIDEFDQIVKLTKKEMYDQGKITKYQVFEYFIQETNLKIEDRLKKFYNYPMHEMGTWTIKKEQSGNWISMSVEEKTKKINHILTFDLLFAEAGILEDDSISKKIEKIDSLANKILSKYKELEKIYGEMFLLRSETKKKLEDILNRNEIDTYIEMEKVFNNI